MSSRCPECGRPVDGSHDELCPSCLLQLGLDAVTDDRTTQSEDDDETIHDTGFNDGSGTWSGRKIGPYRVLGLLGEGGMGQVYLAEQQEPVRRKVALKLIKHVVSSEQTLARFEAERQSLELMDHPSIARMLDAGSTPEGVPYFVMEFVNGIPINRYCDEHRLTTEQRVQLMVRVCDAVQHAHVKGVIHRDIKPSNVLVVSTDNGPLPKVIDFGIAKATGERMLEWSHFTEMGRLIGTPEYMSPEQADTARRDVDTRTDVYALGVILYELLVGCTPHDPAAIRNAGIEEMLRHIREVDHPTPSSRLNTLGDAVSDVAANRATDPGRLVKRVRGELDWITMRAVEKDRERRYGSARELGADLERYLAHEPVQARAPSASYRLRKFARRHRLGVGLVAAGLITLTVFVAAMAWQARLIARERDRARIEAQTSQKVAGLLIDLFRSADPYGTAGEDPTARDVLHAGAERVERELADEPEMLARMLAEMGWAYHGLGAFEKSEQLIERAIAIHEQQLDPESEDVQRSLFHLAIVKKDREKLDESQALFDKVVAIQTRQYGANDRRPLRNRVESAEVYVDAGRYDEARAVLEPVHKIQNELFGPTDIDALQSGVMLAAALSHASKRDEAQPYIDAALAGLHMPDTYDERRAGLMMRLGWTCLFLERYEDSEKVYREILESRIETLGRDHVQTLNTRAMLASILDEREMHDEAIAMNEEVLQARTRVLGPLHTDTLFTHSIMGSQMLGAKRYEDAARRFQIAIDGHKESGDVGFRPMRARSGLARSLRYLGRYEPALEQYAIVQTYCDEELFDRHPICLDNLGDTALIYRAQGRVSEAEKLEARVNKAKSERKKSSSSN